MNTFTLFSLFLSLAVGVTAKSVSRTFNGTNVIFQPNGDFSYRGEAQSFSVRRGKAYLRSGEVTQLDDQWDVYKLAGEYYAQHLDDAAVSLKLQPFDDVEAGPVFMSAFDYVIKARNGTDPFKLYLCSTSPESVVCQVTDERVQPYEVTQRYIRNGLYIGEWNGNSGMSGINIVKAPQVNGLTWFPKSDRGVWLTNNGYCEVDDGQTTFYQFDYRTGNPVKYGPFDAEAVAPCSPLGIFPTADGKIFGVPDNDNDNLPLYINDGRSFVTNAFIARVSDQAFNITCFNDMNDWCPMHPSDPPSDPSNPASTSLNSANLLFTLSMAGVFLVIVGASLYCCYTRQKATDVEKPLLAGEIV